MAFMEFDRADSRHTVFQGDVEREHEGLLAELSEPERMSRHLEDQIIGECGRATEAAVKMLQTFGSM